MAADQVPMVTALDTSVIVSILLSWHAHHEVASLELAHLLESGTTQRLLTFNRTHFERLSPEDIEIRVPGTTR